MTAVQQPTRDTLVAPASAPRRNGLITLVRSHPRAAILFGFCALSFLLFASTWTDPSSHVIGHLDGDQQADFWAIAWPAWAITHGHNPLLTGYLNAPAGANLLWTYPPLFGIVAAPVTLLAGPVFSYNLITTLGLAGSGWLAAVATRRLVPSWIAAVAAGLLYGFGPYELGQALDHVVLTMQFAPPLLLLLLHEALVRQRARPWKVGLGLAALVVMQLLSFLETIAILGLVTAISLLVLWFLRGSGWRSRLPYAARVTAIGAALTVVLCAYPLGVMFLGPEHLGSGAVREPGTVVSNLANIVVPSPVQLVAATHDVTSRPLPHATDNPAEWGAYIGIPLLLLLFAVTWRCWSQTLVRFAAITGGIVAVLSLGPTLWLTVGLHTSIHLPAVVLAYLPLVENVLPSRFAIVVDLFAALLLAVYIAQSRRQRPLLRPWQHRALMAAVVASLLPVIPYPTSAAPVVPAFFTGADVLRIPDGSVALIAPFTENGADDDPQYWQAASGFRFRMVGGYVFVPGTVRPTYPVPGALTGAMLSILQGERGSDLSAGDRGAMLTELQQDHVGTVVIGPMPLRSVMVRFMTNLMGRPPQEDRGVEVWWSVT